MLLCTSVIIITFSQTVKSKKHADAKVKFSKWVEKALLLLSPFIKNGSVKQRRKEERPKKC